MQRFAVVVGLFLCLLSGFARAGGQPRNPLRMVSSCAECEKDETCHWGRYGYWCRSKGNKEAIPKFSALLVADGAECRKVRKVSCSEECREDEESKPKTKHCVFSKEQYKKDGIGCIRYDDVCWCGPPCPREGGDIKL